MKVTAELNNLRISPRKVRLVADFIKGCNTDEALARLNNTVKRSSGNITKLLNSAIANAENNFGLDKDNLYVHSIQVGEGITLKRWRPRAYGRAATILKRTSGVKLVLEEKVEGKNRKSKEQLDKEKKARENKRKKMEKEMVEGKETTQEDVKTKKEKILAEHKKGNFEPENERKQSRESGWAKKIFRRKSV